MPIEIDYYFTPQSPWTYLGHQRFWQIAQAAQARINVLPVDLGRKVFPHSGGLPLNKRAPQRQAYRLLEMRRFSEHLGLPIKLQPKYFPVNDEDAAQLIIAVDMKDGTEAAMALSGALMKAVWVDDLNIADEAVLTALLHTQGLSESRLQEARSQAVHERFEEDSQRAIEAGVFGAPSYVVEGEIFWGQDRLDFLERRLQTLATPLP
jgi:2-hydroxychromene-2-carboxylate isomerase